MTTLHPLVFGKHNQAPLLSYDELRPLLRDVEDKGVRAAVDAYDQALAHQAAAPPLPDRQRQATAEVEAERRAAALAGRAPTLDHAHIDEARKVDADAQADREARYGAVCTRAVEVRAALDRAAPAVLVVVARARALIDRAILDVQGNLADIPPALRILHERLRWPALAYGPGQVTGSIRLDHGLAHWWPLTLGGWVQVAGSRFAHERHQWNEWAWAELARGTKAFTVTDTNLQFRQVWAPPPKRATPGALVAIAGQTGQASRAEWMMIGTGPNGEQGGTLDQLGLRPVTFG